MSMDEQGVHARDTTRKWSFRNAKNDVAESNVGVAGLSATFVLVRC